MMNDMLRASKKTCNTYESYEQALKGIRDFEVDWSKFSIVANINPSYYTTAIE